MKALVILNPHAHSGQQTQNFEAVRDDISARLKNALQLDTVDWCETEHPGHAKELAQEAVKNKTEYIFAGGGDGTINEVLNGIMVQNLKAEQNPIFGVLPFGTSNDFYVALKAAEAARKSETKDELTMKLDIGHVWFDDVERYFCLTTGMGLFSWANEQYLDTSQVFGRRFAHVPAAIRTLLSYRFLPNVRIAVDAKRSHSRRMLSLVVNNSPVVAGGTALTPDAKLNDGLLDVCLIKSISIWQLFWLMFQVESKTHKHSRAVQMGRIREITVVARQPLPIHIDGELVPEIESKARRMRIKILPSALCIVIPSLCEIVPSAPKPVETVSGTA